MRGFRWVPPILAAFLLAVGSAACATDPPAPSTPAPLPRVVVGSGDTAVDDLLGRIYAGALARMGTTVTTRPELGGRGAYLAALSNGAVSLVPDFTDDLLRYYDPDAMSTDPDDVRRDLSRSLPEGISVSDPSDTTDWRARMVMVSATADRLGVHSIVDLADHCAGLTLGVAATTAVPTTDDRCRFAAVRRLPGQQLIAAIRSGRVGVAVVGPTFDIGSDLTALSDDKYVFPACNPVPVFRSGTVSQLQQKTLNRVAGELDTDHLADMVRRVAAHRDTPDALVHSWLDLHGF